MSVRFVAAETNDWPAAEVSGHGGTELTGTGVADSATMRWPSDLLSIVESRWDAIAPVIDAVTRQTGNRRMSVEESLALPLVSELVAITHLGSLDAEDVTVLGAPAELAAVLRAAVSLSFAEDRLVGMPLDVLARLHPQLRGIPGAAIITGAVRAAKNFVTALRTADWSFHYDDTPSGRRAARLFGLSGASIATVSAPGAAPSAMARCTLMEDSGRYLWSIPMPGLRKEDLRLTRSGDRLLVLVEGVALPMDLAPVLRRCQVSGAICEDDTLVITFLADKRKWTL